MLSNNGSNGMVGSGLPLKLLSMETTLASHTTQLLALQDPKLNRGGWTTLSTNVISDSWSWNSSNSSTAHNFTDTALDMSLITSGIYTEFRILIDKSSYLTCTATGKNTNYVGMSSAELAVANQRVLRASVNTAKTSAQTFNFALEDDILLILNNPITSGDQISLTLGNCSSYQPTGSFTTTFANSNIYKCYMEYLGSSTSSLTAADWDVYIVYELQGR